ncbi:MAG: hypothetical protein EPN76_11685 [Burkholderiaceae bacterium]|nr:MAG: hypothetical protein EPN76_11685 [Burkholderiaceae bacterium]TAM08160.1 MAG: hypothetical protein EPN67_02895 [Pusillimonas sp.]
MHAFTAMLMETVGRTLEASPVAVAVQEFVDKAPNGLTAPLKDILRKLEQFKPVGTEAWPRSPKGLGDALRRAAPALRTCARSALNARVWGVGETTSTGASEKKE